MTSNAISLKLTVDATGITAIAGGSVTINESPRSVDSFVTLVDSALVFANHMKKLIVGLASDVSMSFSNLICDESHPGIKVTVSALPWQIDAEFKNLSISGASQTVYVTCLW